MRVLQICTALDGGGVDRYLLNYCTRIPEIAFDFVVIDTGKKVFWNPNWRNKAPFTVFLDSRMGSAKIMLPACDYVSNPLRCRSRSFWI